MVGRPFHGEPLKMPDKPKPRLTIDKKDLARLKLAVLQRDRARDRVIWLQEALEADYALRPTDMVDWNTGEVFDPTQTELDFEVEARR